MAEATDSRRRWAQVLLAWLGGWFISLLMLLNRRTTSGLENLDDALAGDRPVYIGFWHGRLIYAAWFLRRFHPATLVSRSDDGELIAHILKRWGYRTIRGSSRKGAQEALRELLRLLDDRAFLVAVTMDGPLGPPHVVKPGSLAAARRKGAVILPLGCTATRKWVFTRSWDRFELPKPFGRLVIQIGEPIAIAPSAGDDEAASVMAAATNQMEAAADAYAQQLG